MGLQPYMDMGLYCAELGGQPGYMAGTVVLAFGNQFNLCNRDVLVQNITASPLLGYCHLYHMGYLRMAD